MHFQASASSTPKPSSTILTLHSTNLFTHSFFLSATHFVTCFVILPPEVHSTFNTWLHFSPVLTLFPVLAGSQSGSGSRLLTYSNLGPHYTNCNHLFQLPSSLSSLHLSTSFLILHIRRHSWGNQHLRETHLCQVFKTLQISPYQLSLNGLHIFPLFSNQS